MSDALVPVAPVHRCCVPRACPENQDWNSVAACYDGDNGQKVRQSQMAVVYRSHGPEEDRVSRPLGFHGGRLPSVPGLITFSSTTSSKCNHPLCPSSNNSHARIVDSLVAVNPHKIDQESLEASLTPGESPCSLVMDPKEVDEHGSEVFRKQCLHDPETKETTEWYICSGQRTYSKRVFNMPYLLVLDCLYHWRQGQQAKKPATILHVGGNEYHLAAIVYGSGAHFCGTTFIKSKAVFYDGQKARKLRWLDSRDISVPQGYQMNQVWYLRRDEGEPPSSPLPESDDPSSPRAESNSGDHDGAENEQEQCLHSQGTTGLVLRTMLRRSQDRGPKSRTTALSPMMMLRVNRSHC